MKLKKMLPTMALLLVVLFAGCKKDEDTGIDSLGTSSDLLIEKSGDESSKKTDPANGATGVSLSQVITVNFNNKMSSERIARTSLTLNMVKPGGVNDSEDNDSEDNDSEDNDSEDNDSEGMTIVAGTVAYAASSASFTPAANLAPNTKYQATVITSSKDKYHRYQAKKGYSWSFTTGAVTGTTSPSVTLTDPSNNATGVAFNKAVAVTFSKPMDPSTINAATFTLKQGTTVVSGVVTYTGSTATFTPAAVLAASKVYTGTITTGAKDIAGTALAASYVFNFTTGTGTATDVTLPTVVSTVPANNATAVALNAAVAVNFSEAMNATSITTTTFALTQGTTVVSGVVSYTGTKATFTPSASLVASKIYTGTITTGAKDLAGNALGSSYVFNFTTAAGAVVDVTPPTVSSSDPLNNATAIAINKVVAVNFSEAMTASTISAATFTLKQGATAVAGTVTYTGTKATFTSSANLAANTVYTGTVTTGAKDVAGNALGSNYTFSFTTAAAADVTAPTVGTVVPANSATAVAVTSKVTASFSEAMNASTITTATFTLKQGTANVAGTVTYSGTTATFSPSASLAGGTVFTATVTTGAKDAAGNAITASKVWSFTTVASVVLTSWSSQVWPIIQSKCTPCHGTSGGSAGVNMGNYAQVSGMSNSAIDNSGMYSKLNVTSAEQTIIKAWIAQGKLNN